MCKLKQLFALLVATLSLPVLADTQIDCLKARQQHRVESTADGRAIPEVHQVLSVHKPEALGVVTSTLCYVDAQGRQHLLEYLTVNHDW